VRNIATASSKKTYDSPAPTVSCKKVPTFLWPEEAEDICITQTGFTRTKPKFRACLGWLQTKTTAVKNEAKSEINKSTVQHPPSPFGYNNYKMDIAISEQASRQRKRRLLEKNRALLLSELIQLYDY